MWANEQAYDATITAVAAEQAPRAGVSTDYFVALMKAHIGQESRFEPTAYHWDGPDPTLNVSRGIAQIEGATAIAAGITDLGEDVQSGPDAPAFLEGRVGGLYDPEIALPLMGRIIADNLVATGGNVPEAIAAYNEGLGRARTDEAGGTGAFRDQAYVDSVQQNLAYFLGQAPPESGPQDASSSPPAPAGTGPVLIVVILVVVVGLALLARRFL